MPCIVRSKHSGVQCNRHAIAGGNVCPMHGGAAPQVKRGAQERLLALVDPAIVVLISAMKRKYGKGVNRQADAVALKAAHDVLDRAGLKQPDKVESSGQLSISEILRDRRENSAGTGSCCRGGHHQRPAGK